MANESSESKVTTNHDEIRRWVEEREGIRPELKIRRAKTAPGCCASIIRDSPAATRSRRLAGTNSLPDLMRTTSRFFTRRRRRTVKRAASRS